MTTNHPGNRLSGQTSPYLRQHAHNPVDWYPWGGEAIDRARAEDRPILLSVGYSACHWCHVMERESFEDDDIAALMNERFVNIKVDREERPDVDEIYMGAVQAMTGSGGWPMTVFLTPELRPFYGGTYFPPDDRYGRPGFTAVLKAVAEAFGRHREQTEERASELVAALQRSSELAPREEIGEGIEGAAFEQLRQAFDSRFGGFGSAPKFPGSMSLAFLLRYHRREGGEALDMVQLSLKKMARGGMYDQLGGGFHRYSVDERWLVPHFEKMLYDNALLTWVYLEAYQATGEELYRGVVVETLDYALREMSQPGGGYYSAQDADSEGEEGRYFVWTPEEVADILGPDDGALFCSYYDITAEGNFEGGESILHVDVEVPELSRRLGVDEARLTDTVAEGRRRLLARRYQRIPPNRDDKILVSWNGLMISAMAQAYQVLGDGRYLASAAASASFILDRMVADGGLLHTYKDGKASVRAYQDDYACLVNALVDLYEASFEVSWLCRACELTRSMIARFWDDGDGGFFFTEADDGDLILRTKNPFDNATPSGNSMAAVALLRLAVLTGDRSLRDQAEATLKLFSDLMERSPTGCSQMLCALDYFQEPTYEIAVVGSREKRSPLERALHACFLPNKVVAGAEVAIPGLAAGDPEARCGASGQGAEVAEFRIPLLEGKALGGDGDAAVYVCRDSSCSLPVADVEGLLKLLGKGKREGGS